MEKLRTMLFYGTRVMLLVGLPVVFVLFFRGSTFIGLWMGEQYAEESGKVLRVLLIAQMFTLANYTSLGMSLGFANLRPIVLWSVGEAILNLVISIILVRKMGLIGVAWGTTIPGIITQIVFWPRYITNLLGVNMRSYILDVWCKPLLAVLPFGICCYVSDRVLAANGLVQFFMQLLVMTPVLIAGVMLFFHKDVMEFIRSGSLLPQDRISP